MCVQNICCLPLQSHIGTRPRVFRLGIIIILCVRHGLYGKRRSTSIRGEWVVVQDEEGLLLCDVWKALDFRFIDIFMVFASWSNDHHLLGPISNSTPALALPRTLTKTITTGRNIKRRTRMESILSGITDKTPSGPDLFWHFTCDRYG